MVAYLKYYIKNAGVMKERILGDYHLIKQIGQGSLGTVYLAEHRFLKKQYIIKIPPPELASDRLFIQRFEEEIATLSSLDHPNLVKIHNVSFCDGVYFLVCECVVDDDGETTNLYHYIADQGGSLSEDAIWSILEQIAAALEYAHARKMGDSALVHRNIKLNNILVGKKSGNKPRFALSDFGLSRIVGTGAVLNKIYKTLADILNITSILSLNQKGSEERYTPYPIEFSKLSSLHTSFLQSYLFLAPEQKKLSELKKVSPKSDIFTFGVLAYYLLMGYFPEGIFPLPSSKWAKKTKDWDRLITSCLHLDPALRPSSLVQLLKECEQVSIPSAPPIIVAEIPKETKKILESPAPQKLKPVIHSQHIDRPHYDPNPELAFLVDPTVKVYHPKQEEVKDIEPILTEMAVIKGGYFYRGSQQGNRDEQPQHKIFVNSFALDIHCITNEQFVRFLEAMGGEKDAYNNDIIRLRESRIKRHGGKLSIESGYAKHPVVGVSWYGANSYAKWVGKRLPTEAEWEIAARGGVENITFPTGDNIEKNQANFFSSDTTAVMSYAPTEFGLYDMAGNVYEWCLDWYSYTYYEISVQEPDNPKGPLQGVYRVLRGGCWKSLKDDLRCSHRHRNNPGTLNRTYGFRCAADVK